MLKKKIYKKNKKRGQSTVEYIILVSAILAVVIVFLGPNGLFRASVNDVLESSVNEMNGMAEILFNRTN